MVRRSILVTLAVAIAAALARRRICGDRSERAAADRDRSTCRPALFTWTPGADLLNIVADRLPRARRLHDAARGWVSSCASTRATRRTQHFAVPGDGTFCFFVRAADLLLGTADSPGLTLTIDTTRPTATVAVSNTGARRRRQRHRERHAHELGRHLGRRLERPAHRRRGRVRRGSRARARRWNTTTGPPTAPTTSATS